MNSRPSTDPPANHKTRRTLSEQPYENVPQSPHNWRPDPYSLPSSKAPPSSTARACGSPWSSSSTSYAPPPPPSSKRCARVLFPVALRRSRKRSETGSTSFRSGSLARSSWIGLSPSNSGPTSPQVIVGVRNWTASWWASASPSSATKNPNVLPKGNEHDKNPTIKATTKAQTATTALDTGRAAHQAIPATKVHNNPIPLISYNRPAYFQPSTTCFSTSYHYPPSTPRVFLPH